MKTEIATIDSKIASIEVEQTENIGRDPGQLVEAAMELLNDVARITSSSDTRPELHALLQRLGVRIGLRFVSQVKGKKRVVQRLTSGRMVFGDAQLPVPIFGKNNVDDSRSTKPTSATSTNRETPSSQQMKQGDSQPTKQTRSLLISQDHSTKDRLGMVLNQDIEICNSQSLVTESQPEGISVRKGNRGERI